MIVQQAGGRARSGWRKGDWGVGPEGAAGWTVGAVRGAGAAALRLALPLAARHVLPGAPVGAVREPPTTCGVLLSTVRHSISQ